MLDLVLELRERRRAKALEHRFADTSSALPKIAPLSQSDNAMTKTSAMMGSPLYMSPEQMTSVRDVDARSDIWALGIILFELLTGSTPFVGETLPQVCGLVIQSPDPPVSSRRQDLPRELDAILHRCLAKNPNDRYQNAAELAQALQTFAGRHGRASVERILMLAGGTEPASLPRGTVSNAEAPAATGHASGTHAAWGETKPPVPGQRSAGWLALPLVGVPAIAAAAWWLVSTPRSDNASPEASASVVTAAEPIVSVPQREPVMAPPAAGTPASAAPAPAAEAPAAAPARPATGDRKPASAAGRPAGAKDTPGPQPAAAAPAPAPAAPATSPAPNTKPPTMGGRL